MNKAEKPVKKSLQLCYYLENKYLSESIFYKSKYPLVLRSSYSQNFKIFQKKNYVEDKNFANAESRRLTPDAGYL